MAAAAPAAAAAAAGGTASGGATAAAAVGNAGSNVAGRKRGADNSGGGAAASSGGGAAPAAAKAKAKGKGKAAAKADAASLNGGDGGSQPEKKGKTELQSLIAIANKLKVTYHSTISKAASLIDQVNNADDESVWAGLKGKWNIGKLEAQRKTLTGLIDEDMNSILFKDLATLKKNIAAAPLTVHLQKFLSIEKQVEAVADLHQRLLNMKAACAAK